MDSDKYLQPEYAIHSLLACEIDGGKKREGGRELNTGEFSIRSG